MTTIRQVTGGLWIPEYIPTATIPTKYTWGLDGDTTHLAFIIQVPLSGKPKGFEFYCSAVDQCINGITVSLREVDGVTGEPSATALVYREGIAIVEGWNYTEILSQDGTDNGARQVWNRSTRMACVIEFTNYQTGDTIGIDLLDRAAGTAMDGPHYVMYKNVSGWARLDKTPIMALRYLDDDDTEYYKHVHGTWIPSVIDVITFNSSTTPDEVGMAFLFPTDVRVSCVWVRSDIRSDVQVLIYDSDGQTVIDTSAIKYLEAANKDDYYCRMVQLSSDLLIRANEIYRVTVKALDTTDSHIIGFTADSTELMKIHPNAAAVVSSDYWYRTERTNSGDWTDHPSKGIFMGFNVSGLEQGGGIEAGWEGDA